MPEYLGPGVYVEEIPFESHPIEGVSTSTPGFVGTTISKVRKRRFHCGVILAERVRKRRLCLARALAHELRRDLYRVDLAALISKYIGETEKNLQRLFSRVQKNGAILFFDEADALFGKRSGIKDASERFDHFSRPWFLEQLKAFRGVAFLAVKRKASLDAAFLRRFRYILVARPAKELRKVLAHCPEEEREI